MREENLAVSERPKKQKRQEGMGNLVVDQRNDYRIKYPHTYKGNRTEQSRRWRAKNKLKTQAHAKINNAIYEGKIIKPDFCCICNGQGGIVAHHHDYDKPFEVIWVCYKCHNDIHRVISERGER